MDNKKLVEQVKTILCSINKLNIKYDTAWLSFEDDLTGRERYILNVKAEHTISSCYDEIRFLTKTLWEQLDPKSLKMISRIAVYNSSEQVHCWGEDILLLEDASVCK